MRDETREASPLDLVPLNKMLEARGPDPDNLRQAVPRFVQSIENGPRLSDFGIGETPDLAVLALQAVGQDIDEARARIEATRDALQATAGGQEAPDGTPAALVARLGRMADEVARIERVIEGQAAAG
jgi:hypothetical protein